MKKQPSNNKGKEEKEQTVIKNETSIDMQPEDTVKSERLRFKNADDIYE